MHIHTNEREELMRSKARPEAALRWGRPPGAALLALALAACGGGGSLIGADATIGGSVSGLSGAGLVLRNNGSESLSVPAAGRFVFVNPVPRGAAYAVTVATQPAGQTCVVANGSGTAPDAGNVENIGVTCTNTTPPPPPPAGSYTIGGTVSGLTGSGLVLNNNGGNDLAVTANGAFTFSTAIAGGAAYAVTVATPPSGQRCDVANGSGTVAAANVTGVTVTCTSTTPPPPPPNTYSVGGSITGYTGRGLVLQLNGGDGITLVAGATTFAFPGQLAGGSNYAVTIAVPAYGQDCSLTNASGSIDSANVNNVLVTCGPVAPLTLVSSAPADLETGVARTVQPRLNFSAAIDPATVNGASVGFSFRSTAPSTELPAAATFGFDGTSMTLTPTRKLLPLTTYAYSVGTDVRGVRGQQLERGQARSFTTGDGAWQTPTAFSELTEQDRTQIATNNRGNAVVVGKIAGAGGAYVSYHYNAATAQWRGPRTLALPQSALSFEARQLAIDEAGNAMVVAIESAVVNGGIRDSVIATRYDAAADAWAAPVTVPKDDATLDASLSTVVATQDGQFFAAWVSGVSQGVRLSRYAGSWTASPSIVYTKARDVFVISDLKVTVGPLAGAAGQTPLPTLMLTWVLNDSNLRYLWGRRFNESGSLSNPPSTVISQTDGSFRGGGDYRVAFDRLGRAYVVWTQRSATSGAEGVTMRRNLPTADGRGQWGQIELVEGVVNGNASNPRVVVDRSGEAGAEVVWLAWLKYRLPSGRPELWASRIVANGLPSAPWQINMTDHAVDDDYALAVDRAGNAMALWRPQNPDTVDTVLFRRFNAQTNTWGTVSPALNRDDVNDLAGGFHIGVSANGDALTGWMEIDSALRTQTLRVLTFR
jgi:Bacterial Ig-like domain